jgi:hypothetical protein
VLARRRVEVMASSPLDVRPPRAATGRSAGGPIGVGAERSARAATRPDGRGTWA